MEYIQEHINKAKKRDRSDYVLLLLLLLIFFFGILLYRNIFRKGKIGNNPVIGILTFKNKIVERKLDSEVIWDKVESGIEIRNRDTIRSADFSDALLTLKDTTKISMSENSMIYLDLSDGMNLDFAYGSLSLEGGNGQPITIKSEDKIIEVNNANIQIEKKSKEELKLEVKEGEVKVKSGNEEKQVKKNEVATVEEKKITIEEAVIQLISPSEYYSLSTRTGSTSIDFSYRFNSVVIKPVIEFSYDSRFRKIIKSVPLQSDSISLDMKSGQYYWRVTGEHKQKGTRESSGFRKLVVLGIRSPRLLTPKNNQNISFTNNPPVVNVSWTSAEGAKVYKVEISSDKEFNSIVKSIQTSQNYLGVDGLKEGSYFLRLITEFNLKGESLDSTEAIRINLTQKKDPDPPVHVSTRSEDQVFDKNILQKKGYTLVWKDSPEFAKYDLQVAEDKEFQKVILSEKTPNNHRKLNFAPKSGTYYWRVAGVTKDGKSSGYSKVARITIKSTESIQTISPARGAEFAKGKSTIQFRWKKIETTPLFKWEISKSADFSNILHSENINGYVMNFNTEQSGKYFWRVHLLDESGNTMISSNPSDFSIRELEPPKAIFPTMGQRVDMSRLDYLDFRWQADNSFKSFLFELYGVNNKLIVSQRTNNKGFIFRDLSKLDEGNFTWKLKGFLPDNREMDVEGELIRFTIFLSQKPTPPKLKTPKKIFMD
jgi:hypothetical protein